jgi:hypothetical protein
VPAVLGHHVRGDGWVTQAVNPSPFANTEGDMEILIQGMALITVVYFAVMFWIDIAWLIGASVRETWLAMETRPPPPRPATCGPGMIARHPDAA